MAASEKKDIPNVSNLEQEKEKIMDAENKNLSFSNTEEEDNSLLPNLNNDPESAIPNLNDPVVPASRKRHFDLNYPPSDDNDGRKK
ncbi:hypothetical protein L195_g005202, partial [Trifolium pratense]